MLTVPYYAISSPTERVSVIVIGAYYEWAFKNSNSQLPTRLFPCWATQAFLPVNPEPLPLLSAHLIKLFFLFGRKKVMNRVYLCCP